MVNQDLQNDLEAEKVAATKASNGPQAEKNSLKKNQTLEVTPAAKDEHLGEKVARAINPNVQACIFAALAVLGTAFLLFGVIGKNQILDRLSHIEHARGLITFTLTVGTISIAILVTIGALMGRDDDARERFYRAKEILTILIGVLGTIVGFYFGSQDNAGERVALRVAAPILSSYKVVSGDLFTLNSFVSEGNPPYKYEISFKGNLIERAVGYADDTGWITKTFTAPETNVSINIEYTLKVTDVDEETTSFVSSEDKHILVEPK